MHDAIKVAYISGCFGLVAIPFGLLLKRYFDLQDRREAEDETERRECVRFRLGYQLAVEQLRNFAQTVVALERCKEHDEGDAFTFGWAQLQERASQMEYDFLTMVDADAHEERRESRQPVHALDGKQGVDKPGDN